MKKLLVSVMLALPAMASAGDFKPYVEGQIGYYNVDDVSTKTYSGDNYSGKIKIKYDSDVNGGLEFGFKDIGVDNFRIAASYQRASFDSDKVKAKGSVTINGTTYSGSVDVTSALKDEGIDLDNSVNLYMINAYYDFKNSSAFTPFVGVGVGVADIKNAKDNEFAYSFSAGGKYYLDKNLYAGVKATFTSVNSPTDKLGIDYKDINMYSGHILLGYEF